MASVAIYCNSEHHKFYRLQGFLKTLFVTRVPYTPSRVLNYLYNIWQDAGIWTRVAAPAARCATNELHTSLKVFKEKKFYFVLYWVKCTKNKYIFSWCQRKEGGFVIISMNNFLWRACNVLFNYIVFIFFISLFSFTLAW